MSLGLRRLQVIDPPMCCSETRFSNFTVSFFVFFKKSTISSFDRRQNTDDSISLLDKSDIVYESRHYISSILPPNFHCLKRADGRFQLVASLDAATAEKMDVLIDFVRGNFPENKFPDNKFILVEKVVNGDRKLDSIRNCLQTTDHITEGHFYER